MADERYNPPAFAHGDPVHGGEPGMSLRDWFASQCKVEVYCPATSFESAHGNTPTVGELAEYIAKIRFIEADAMLREKGGAK